MHGRDGAGAGAAARARPRAGRRVRRADRARWPRPSAASSTSSNATSTPSTRPGSSRPARSGSSRTSPTWSASPDLPPDLPGVTSRRAFVANTVRYRQRQGHGGRRRAGRPGRLGLAGQGRRVLPAARRDDAREPRADSTGPRRRRSGRPSTRAGPLELVPAAVAQGALHGVAHTAEVRRIASGAAATASRTSASSSSRDQVYELGWAPPTPPAADEGWSVHPLRRPTPLFARPAGRGRDRAPRDRGGPAGAAAAAAPPRAAASRPGGRGTGSALAAPLPVAVRVEGAELDAERLRVHRPGGPRARRRPGMPLAGWQVMVDAVTGGCTRSGTALRRRARRRWRCGTATAAPRTWAPAATTARRARAGARRPTRTAATPPAAVPATSPGGAVPRRRPGRASRTRRRRRRSPTADGAWAGPDVAGRAPRSSSPSPTAHATPVDLGRRDRPGGDPAGPGGRVAAARLLGPARRCRRRRRYARRGCGRICAGTLTVTGRAAAASSSTGSSSRATSSSTAGALGSLTREPTARSPATVRVGGGVSDRTPGCGCGCVRSQCAAPSRSARPRPRLDVRRQHRWTPPAAPADAVRGAGAAPERSTGRTVRGAVPCARWRRRARSSTAGSLVEHRQTGCVRYSYLPPGLAGAAPLPLRARPGRRRPGHAPVLRRRPTAARRRTSRSARLPAEIAEGGEGGAEMGVHHHLGGPLRVRAAARLLAPLRAGRAGARGRAPVAVGSGGLTMHGDFSRRTFDRADGYRAVLLQQGRVLLDADWNEQAEITAHHDEVRTRDVVGRSGGPAPDAAATGPAGRSPCRRGRHGAGRPRIRDRRGTTLRDHPRPLLRRRRARRERLAGRCRCRTRSGGRWPTSPTCRHRPRRGRRPGVPEPDAADGDRYALYLDVWQHHVTVDEDAVAAGAGARRPGHHHPGADVWQVRLARLAETMTDVLPTCTRARRARPGRRGGWSPRWSRPSRPPTRAGSPPPAATERLENQLYRVQVHDASDVRRTRGTFLWSRTTAAWSPG